MGLYPLHKTFGLKSFIASTYQAVSGSGTGGIMELEEQARGLGRGLVTEAIKKGSLSLSNCFNLIPRVDEFLEDGYTKEEMKMLNEGRKILGIEDLRVTCTCVRVPVFRAHCISISAEFEKPVSVCSQAVRSFAGAELAHQPVRPNTHAAKLPEVVPVVSG